MANELDVVGIRAATLTLSEDATIGRNLLVSGSVGIGVMTPSEKLDIAGNVRISSTLFSDQVSTTELSSVTGAFSGRLIAEENVLISGLTGMGVNNPAERLEVAGNIKASASLLADGFQVNQGSVNGSLSVTQNTIIDGQVGIGVGAPTEKLEVAGNIKVSQDLLANSIQAVNGTITNDLTINNNAIVNGNIGVGVDSPTERLEISGNIKASENIISVGIQAEQGTLTKGLTIGENVLVEGNIGLGVKVPEERLDVAGNIKVSGFVNTNQLSATGTTTGSLQVNEAMSVEGIALFNSIGALNPTQALEVTGNMQTTGNFTTNSLNANNADITESLTVDGIIKAGIIEADEIRFSDGSVPGSSSSDEFTVNRLAVNTSQAVPSGYVMAVAGKMLATRVEVFAPEKWPDYVFEEDYQLRSLEDVETYINKYGHLPNVPSSQAIQEGGYSVAQMDANLLEKIEELTLYMIELKKENQLLKEQLQKLNK